MPIWIDTKHRIRIEKGDPGPPTMGRWKVYVDDRYTGSAPDKASARGLAKDIERDLCAVGDRTGKVTPMDVNSPEELKSQNKALRAVVADMLAGLAYLRSTDSVPYGFGIDRLEQAGRAALGDD